MPHGHRKSVRDCSHRRKCTSETADNKRDPYDTFEYSSNHIIHLDAWCTCADDILPRAKTWPRQVQQIACSLEQETAVAF